MARASSAILKNARPANLYSLSDELAQKYLRRLRIHAPPPITTAGLSSLVKAHTSRIPWGNLDIHMGILPPHKFEAAAPPSNVCALLPIEDLTERLLQRGLPRVRLDEFLVPATVVTFDPACLSRRRFRFGHRRNSTVDHHRAPQS